MERASSDLYLLNDEIALEFGKLAAARLTSNRLAAFRDSIRRSILRSGNNPYYQTWLQLIQSGPEPVAKALTERTARGQVLRSVLSFQVFFNNSERQQIVRKFAQNRPSHYPPPPSGELASRTMKAHRRSSAKA